MASATAIAISPLSPAPDILTPAVGSASTAVEPTAFLTPWVSALNTASAEATRISQAFWEAPGAGLQQLILNQSNYLNTLVNNPGALGDVFNSMAANLKNVFEGTTLLYPIDPNSDADAARLYASNDALHALVVGLLPALLPADMNPQLAEIVTYAVRALGSPLSGVAIGLLGPIISPLVETVNLATALFHAPDLQSALKIVVDAPAALANSVLNGATLNLDGLVPILSKVLPPELSVTHLEFAFGGLFTGGNTGLSDDPLNTPGPNLGGSIMNSLGMSALGIPIPAAPVGPLGALVSLSHVIGHELGWDGVGNPLTHLSFPTINLFTPTPAAAKSTAPEPAAVEAAAAPAELSATDTAPAAGLHASIDNAKKRHSERVSNAHAGHRGDGGNGDSTTGHHNKRQDKPSKAFGGKKHESKKAKAAH